MVELVLYIYIVSGLWNIRQSNNLNINDQPLSNYMWLILYCEWNA